MGYTECTMLLILLSCSRPQPPQPPPPAAPVDTDWQVIGQSIQGRDIRLRTLGSGPRSVLWIGGIHGDEAEGAVASAELPAAFLEDPTRAQRVTLHLIEDLNPDGRAAVTRGNANDVDLNRNYPAAFSPAESLSLIHI